ncbi:hypothetical protein C5167_031731 [Papaver somniferum]|uniref:Uncharacterized protein n=1 Tax=Papaver somniferum TaxID=3469 RepID=A0A4Y7K7W3_PAPSO|nr:hypothetical protein C5167_031731 [Papaver somniferum]
MAPDLLLHLIVYLPFLQELVLFCFRKKNTILFCVNSTTIFCVKISSF